MINTISLLISSMMICNPEKYVDYEKLHAKSSSNTGNSNLTEVEDAIELDGATSDNQLTLMEDLTEQAMIDIGNNGIEIMVESMFMLIVSSLLLHGLRYEKCSYIFPWIIVNVLVTAANFVFMTLKIAAPTPAAVLEMGVTVVVLFITSYFILSVYSFYQLIKIRKAKVVTFLNNEFQADSESGTPYRILVEEDANDQPPPYSDVATARPMPFTEKHVVLTETEDASKENVLYVQN